MVVDVGAGFSPPVERSVVVVRGVVVDVERSVVVVRGVVVDAGAGFSPPVEGVVGVEPERVVGVVDGIGVVGRATGVVPVRTPSRDNLCADSRTRKSRLSRVG